MARRVLILLSLVSLASVGAACGDDDDDESSAADLEAFCEGDFGEEEPTPAGLRRIADQIEDLAPDEVEDEASVMAGAFREAAEADDPEAATSEVFADPDVQTANSAIEDFCAEQEG